VQAHPVFQKGDYATYDVEAFFIEFSNHTTVYAPSQSSIRGLMRWEVTDPNPSNTTLILSLNIQNMGLSSKVFVQDRTAYYANGTAWGYFPFWIDDSKVGDVFNVSGRGTSLSIGHISGGNSLMSTPSGWQDTYVVDSVNRPKLFNITLTPWYFFHQRTGLLVQMSGDNPVWTLLGNFYIAGTVTLQATSIYLGPQDPGFILIYLYEAWPLILIAGIFFVFALLYRRKRRQMLRPVR
jgi:hypothetical protein